MQKLNHTSKCFFLGGTARTSISGETLTSSNYIKRTKRTASSNTIWNRRMNYAGHTAIAIASIGEHLYYSIPKLISIINKNEELYDYLSKNQHPYKLKPIFRFSRDYWTSTIAYGSSNAFF